jgi:hypothetical protein
MYIWFAAYYNLSIGRKPQQDGINIQKASGSILTASNYIKIKSQYESVSMMISNAEPSCDTSCIPNVPQTVSNMMSV